MNETILRFKDAPGADAALFMFIRFHLFLKARAHPAGIERPEGSPNRKTPRDGVLMMLDDILRMRLAA